MINEAIEEVDPSIRIISEPGRYYVSSAFTLACLVFGKKVIDEEEGSRYMYYINDGIFGSFMDHMVTRIIRYPIPLNKVCRQT